MHGTGTFCAEDQKRWNSDEKKQKNDLNCREDVTFRGGHFVGAVERKTLVQRDDADSDTGNESNQPDQCVKIASSDTEHHAQRAAEEHQRTDHDKKSKNKADHRIGAGSGGKFFSAGGDDC